ncbi:MAG: hypothetical protein GX877_00035 [Bacteroidales bacterium]|nr:hypothetical protein [Bacteroidales bacterium]
MKKTVFLLFLGLLISCKPQEKPKTIPTVTTGEITDITTTTATCTSEVTDDGGADVTARGVCWSTSEEPTIEDSKTEDDTGLGEYTSSITDLAHNTTYYVRAYATNSEGTAYGEQKTFTTREVQTIPAVTTGEITDITTTTATCTSEVTDDGGADVTARGVCWSTSEEPTTEDSKTEDGTGLGEYESSITDLTLNTTYYVRAYATNSEGTAYGEQKTFTTREVQTIPAVTTGEIRDITSTTATCTSEVTDNGGAKVTARGVCWSPSEDPTIENFKTEDGTGMGAYTSSITDLTLNTTYYVRAYATNSEGTAYGEQKTFITKDIEYGSLTDERDDNVYKTIQIGDQIWMAENLKYLPSVVGPETSSLDDPCYYVYGYDGSDVATAKAESNYQTYGVLYNWPAAMDKAASSTSNPSGVQGACPEGWHLPSHAEWTQLKDYLIANGYNFDSSTTSNRIAKSMASDSGWDTSENIGTVGNSDYPEYRNKSGFSALPGGVFLAQYGGFIYMGNSASWWSSTEIEYDPIGDPGVFAPNKKGFGKDGTGLSSEEVYPAYAMSVRCVKD